jgi:hypothetical protein
VGSCPCKRELDGADAFTFEEFGAGSDTERFQQAGLHLPREGVYLVNPKACGANPIPQLLLSHGSFKNPAERRPRLLERCRPWIKVPRLTSPETPWQHHTYRARHIGSRYAVAEDSSLRSPGFDNHGFNSLPETSFATLRVGRQYKNNPSTVDKSP